jgi:Arc/MetJ-type ribon-helix-helix transcriptional regulator
MAHDKYRSVRLPEELVESIEKEIRSGKRGYKSIAEFIKEAIREKLESVLRK